MIKPLFQKVIVAYNGSLSSLHAVMYGIMMAKQYKSDVKVVYVVDDASIRELVLSKFMLKEEGERMKERLHADGERDVEYIKSLAKQKNVKIETLVTQGVVWSEIVQASVDYKANLILLGGSTSSTIYNRTHSYISKQDSEIMGSAPCSVMVVKEPYIEQLFKLT